MITILSFGSHPDDIEIGCGGTEILLGKSGNRIIHVIATSGEEGGLNISPHQLSRQREAEAIRSANLIGAEEVLFLRLPDALTSYDKTIKIQIIEIIRKYKPDVVFTHSAHDQFPDHKFIQHLVLSSLTGAAGPWFPEACGSPHKVPYVFGYEVWNPMNSFHQAISIDSVLDKKLEALACHQTQRTHIDYLAAVKGLAAYRGIMSMTSNYAEVFEVIRTECLSQFCM